MNRKRMKIVYTHGNDGLTYTVGQLLQIFTLYNSEILKVPLLPFLYKCKLFVLSL